MTIGWVTGSFSIVLGIHVHGKYTPLNPTFELEELNIPLLVSTYYRIAMQYSAYTLQITSATEKHSISSAFVLIVFRHLPIYIHAWM